MTKSVFFLLLLILGGCKSKSLDRASAGKSGPSESATAVVVPEAETPATKTLKRVIRTLPISPVCPAEDGHKCVGNDKVALLYWFPNDRGECALNGSRWPAKDGRCHVEDRPKSFMKWRKRVLASYLVPSSPMVYGEEWEYVNEISGRVEWSIYHEQRENWELFHHGAGMGEYVSKEAAMKAVVYP